MVSLKFEYRLIEAGTKSAAIAGFGFVFKKPEVFALVIFDDLVIHFGFVYQGLANFYFLS